MSKDAEIEMLVLQPLFAVDDNAFAVVALIFKYLWILLDVTFAAAMAPGVGDAESESGWNMSKQPLVQFVAEHPPDEVISFVEMTKTVAMANEEFFIVKSDGLGVGMHCDSHLARQVVKDPHIVVADEKVQFNTFVGQLCHAAKNAHEPFGYHIFIGKPKVKYVAQEHHHGGIAPHLVQQLAQLTLAVDSVGFCAKVGVGNEV